MQPARTDSKIPAEGTGQARATQNDRTNRIGIFRSGFLGGENGSRFWVYPMLRQCVNSGVEAPFICFNTI